MSRHIPYHTQRRLSQSWSVLQKVLVPLQSFCVDGTTEPIPRLLKGWIERCDYPTGKNCSSERNHEEWNQVSILSSKPPLLDNDTEEEDDGIWTLEDHSEYLNITFDKFGGYGQYWQDEQRNSMDYLPCQTCGDPHLYRHEVFHWVDIPNGGTRRINCCPRQYKKTFCMNGSCT